jgi:hypothetical protein
MKWLQNYAKQKRHSSWCLSMQTLEEEDWRLGWRRGRHRAVGVRSISAVGLLRDVSLLLLGMRWKRGYSLTQEP